MGVEGMRVADIDRMVDAHMEYQRARARVFWGPSAPMPVKCTESIATVGTLEEVAKAVSTTPENRPVCEGGPNALCVEYRGCMFWTPLGNRRYPEKEAV